MTDRFRTAVRAFGVVVVLLLGAATFLVVNTLIALIAYQFETPWRQEDVRIPVAVVVLGVVLMAVVFRWWGRLFAVGFVGGLFIVAIWGPAWTRHWLDPGGTPRRDAALERTRPARAAAARRRAHDRWVAERRGTGMDESEGIRRVHSVLSCVLVHRDSQGAFPPAEGGLPASERCLDQQRRQKDDYGWRVMYRIDSGGPGIRISVVPDTALDLRGPVFDTDERGLVLRRDSVGARWYAVATPIPRLMRLLVCILEKPDRVPRLGLDTTKLDDMIFGGDCDVNGFRQITEAGGVATAWDPNAARLVLTTGHARFNSTAVHDVFYRPYGLRPGRGFELVARTTNFGDTGIRSYLIESDGAVRATWEKRAPTREDPVVERCEIEPRTPCAPLRR